MHFSYSFCHRIIIKVSGVIAIDKSDVRAKAQGQRSKVKITEVKKNYSILGISGRYLQFAPTDDYEMTQKARLGIEEVPMLFIKFQGHASQKIDDFDPNWAFPDCNSSLNSQKATKWCTKLEMAQDRRLIIFKVFHQVSRSHEPKDRRLWPELSIFGW